MHYISFMIRIIFLIIIFSFASVAMLEFEGKVRELLEKKGCLDSKIDRLGQENTKVLYKFTCLKNNNVIKGLVECDSLGCLLIKRGQ